MARASPIKDKQHIIILQYFKTNLFKNKVQFLKFQLSNIFLKIWNIIENINNEY